MASGNESRPPGLESDAPTTRLPNTNNALQLDVRYATVSDCYRNYSKLRPRRAQHRRHRLKNIIGCVQTKPVCWQGQLKRRRSVS
ncbi:hypothetical protein TNCV_5038841 [Trichonephila clavipes]|nr:hypothetical protein TNCV_5038841 [Trichonephila clavipes]